MRFKLALCSFVFFATCAAFAFDEEDAMGIAVGREAPAVKGEAWITADGKAPDLKGKVFLIEFWFEKCPYCQAAIPQIKSLAAKYADKGLIVVGASMDPEATVKAQREKHGIEYPLLSGARPLSKAYGAELAPAFFLVGREGKILWKGDLDDKNLIPRLEAALKDTK